MPTEVKKSHRNIASVVRTHRLEAEISQKELAEHLGCTDKFIMRVESGIASLPLKMFVRAGKKLEVHPSVFSTAVQMDLSEYHNKVIENEK